MTEKEKKIQNSYRFIHYNKKELLLPLKRHLSRTGGDAARDEPSSQKPKHTSFTPCWSQARTSSVSDVTAEWHNRDPMAVPDTKLSYGFRTPLWFQMHNWIKSSSDPLRGVVKGSVRVCIRRINNEVVRGPQLSPRIGTSASPIMSGKLDQEGVLKVTKGNVDLGFARF